MAVAADILAATIHKKPLHALLCQEGGSSEDFNEER
jgi:hypothetical protein